LVIDLIVFIEEDPKEADQGEKEEEEENGEEENGEEENGEEEGGEEESEEKENEEEENEEGEKEEDENGEEEKGEEEGGEEESLEEIYKDLSSKGPRHVGRVIMAIVNHGLFEKHQEVEAKWKEERQALLSKIGKLEACIAELKGMHAKKMKLFEEAFNA
jgi:hypothetical protein